MKKILSDNIKELRDLCFTHNVKYLYAFGSVNTDGFNDSSDIDFLISFNEMDYSDYADNYFLIADRLEKMLKRPVDLITDKSLGNPYFIESVNQTKTLIYGKGD